MSELVPEVSDIWVSEKEKTIFQIFQCEHIQYEDMEFDICKAIVKKGNEIYVKDFLSADWISKDCKYLGKSKVKINEIFEVQNGR